MELPHKIKLFLWRFCRNTILVKLRLVDKGVRIPVDCPMCCSGVEDLIHVFFTCPFAMACWNYTGLALGTIEDQAASNWLLIKLHTTSMQEVLLIAQVLWGIWFFRNGKVWDNKVVTAAVAMEWSAKSIADWREAKDKRAKMLGSISTTNVLERVKWKKPQFGGFKLNVDAAIKLGDSFFSVGLVLRDHSGNFVVDKTISRLMVATVVEAEAQAILEGL